MKWEGKYLKDDFGNYILENYTVINWTEGETKHSYETDKIPSDVTAPEDAVVSDKNEDGSELKRRKLIQTMMTQIQHALVTSVRSGTLLGW